MFWVVPTTKWPNTPLPLPSCGQTTTFLYEIFFSAQNFLIRKTSWWDLKIKIFRILEFRKREKRQKNIIVSVQTLEIWTQKVSIRLQITQKFTKLTSDPCWRNVSTTRAWPASAAAISPVLPYLSAVSTSTPLLWRTRD